MIDALKRLLRDTLGLPPSLVLALAGLASHLAFCLLLRKPVTWPWGLGAPLLLGLGIEAYEIWVHYRSIGLLAPGNDPLGKILLRHGGDVVTVLVLPALLVGVGQWLAPAAR